jgi:hypothetical protein
LGGEKAKPKKEYVNRTDFVIEFVWTPEKPPSPPTATGVAAAGNTGTSPAAKTGTSTTTSKK